MVYASRVNLLPPLIFFYVLFSHSKIDYVPFRLSVVHFDFEMYLFGSYTMTLDFLRLMYLCYVFFCYYFIYVVHLHSIILIFCSNIVFLFHISLVSDLGSLVLYM